MLTLLGGCKALAYKPFPKVEKNSGNSHGCQVEEKSNEKEKVQPQSQSCWANPEERNALVVAICNLLLLL